MTEYFIGLGAFCIIAIGLIGYGVKRDLDDRDD